jgi:membrane protease YdiL (CAAX protease family)
LLESLTMPPAARQILAFLALAFAFSSIPYALIIHSGHLASGGGMAVRFIMWCPALAALATCALFRIDLATLGWNWRPAKYVGLAYLLPWLYALPVYVACWLVIRGSFAFSAYAARAATSWGFDKSPGFPAWALAILLTAAIGITGSLSTALGEEIGWRGFLLPRLTGHFGFTIGCLFSGLIWAVWHFPLLLFADYNSGTDKRYALACFTVMIIGSSFQMGWLRLKSGSLWPCAMLHASHNLIIQSILDQLTTQSGAALYVTTEFGFGLALTCAAVAVFFWIRRREVENPAQLEPRVRGQRTAVVSSGL